MEEQKKQLMCNDCGCRFEAGTGKEPPEKEVKPQAPPPPSVQCPECKSMNVTTA
ncbi:MAG TPA: hypothetical protein VGJ94_05195 [Syntrophorhabdaceae bacterium]|jgi:Zn finger protein HypA/HybF involved in hydrogenase expression